jgi:hypothetical protein
MMKQLIIILILGALTTNVTAQKDREKIESLRIAHITSELDLSSEKSQVFWPIFNTYDDSKHSLRNEKRAILKGSEQRADAIDELIRIEEAQYLLFKQYIADLRDVLSDDQILSLISAEKKFKERLIKRLHSDRAGEN